MTVLDVIEEVLGKTMHGARWYFLTNVR